MNSDAILKALNRLVNSRELTAQQRNIAQQAMNHIRKQDAEQAELREDVSKWRVPGDKDES